MHNSVVSGRDISSEVGKGFCGNGCINERRHDGCG